jgi:hypothetical protein
MALPRTLVLDIPVAWQSTRIAGVLKQVALYYFSKLPLAYLTSETVPGTQALL